MEKNNKAGVVSKDTSKGIVRKIVGAFSLFEILCEAKKGWEKEYRKWLYQCEYSKCSKKKYRPF